MPDLPAPSLLTVGSALLHVTIDARLVIGLVNHCHAQASRVVLWQGRHLWSPLQLRRCLHQSCTDLCHRAVALPILDLVTAGSVPLECAAALALIVVGLTSPVR
jgi:hypothetical protein